MTECAAAQRDSERDPEREPPAGKPATADDVQDAGQNLERIPHLVGRADALSTFDHVLDTMSAGRAGFLCLVGEPGVGKTSLLDALASKAKDRGILTVRGRAAEFEQEIPFGAFVDALDEYLDGHEGQLLARLGISLTSVLSRMLSALGDVLPETAIADIPGEDASGLGRYRLLRAARRLLMELATPDGLLLILDDIHWVDESTVELLDYLFRHPPDGRLLVALAYRPAQAKPRLAALMESSTRRCRRLVVAPLTLAEVEEFLGSGTRQARSRELYEASGGNPFNLQALIRMGGGVEQFGSGWRNNGGESGELPPAVQAALSAELSGLSPDVLLVVKAAAVAADEFEPSLVAAAAEVPHQVVLDALDVLVSRDVIRPAAAGRFRFRHPIVRHAAYELAPAGWRLKVHDRIAAHLADLGESVVVRARHVERSGRFGSRAAVSTLVEAARAVASYSPATAARWLDAALRMMPAETGDFEQRVDLMLELAQLQTISGWLAEGRETARQVLRLLPVGAHGRRARAVRFASIVERLLGERATSRSLLVAELQRLPDPGSSAALSLRLRLVMDDLMVGELKAARSILEQLPEQPEVAATGDRSEPIGGGLATAVAAIRPMVMYGVGRITDALRCVDAADRLMAGTPDDEIAVWLDAGVWLGWVELFLGRGRLARQHLSRLLVIARSTGQIYILPSLLAGQARAYVMLGLVAEAAESAEESVEVARTLRSPQAMSIAISQQSLVASWSGDHAGALRFSAQALAVGGDSDEWWGVRTHYARATALIKSGNVEDGSIAMRAVCDDVRSSTLDRTSLLSGYEMMSEIEASRGHDDEAHVWADRAERLAHPELDMAVGLARLARAHALCAADPAAAATHARAAARRFAKQSLRIDVARARRFAGIAYDSAGQAGPAHEELRAAAAIFAACGVPDGQSEAVRKPHPDASLPANLLPVMEQLLAGATDTAACRQLNMSARTYSRRVAELLEFLGAETRFQGGAEIMRRKLYWSNPGQSAALDS